MSYRLSNHFMLRHPVFCVVGCGGTGSFVAEGLCRLLLASPDAEVVLVDHDRVERHNLLRHNYFKADLGKFKSEALALRLSRQFDRRISYSIYPFKLSFQGELESLEQGASGCYRVR